VHFAPAGAPVVGGSFCDVTITHGAPHHLLGELVGVTARPKHRTRIPIAAR
jgi:hypothetical protein